MSNLVRFPRKSKPDTFTAYKVDQPKPEKEPSRIDWDEAPLAALVGFLIICMVAMGLFIVGFSALFIAYKFGWWGLLAPIVLGAFVYACYWVGQKVAS
jgi:hypothetical protein